MAFVVFPYECLTRLQCPNICLNEIIDNLIESTDAVTISSTTAQLRNLANHNTRSAHGYEQVHCEVDLCVPARIFVVNFILQKHISTFHENPI